VTGTTTLKTIVGQNYCEKGLFLTALVSHCLKKARGEKTEKIDLATSPERAAAPRRAARILKACNIAYVVSDKTS
jgi:hypothetical protein